MFLLICLILCGQAGRNNTFTIDDAQASGSFKEDAIHYAFEKVLAKSWLNSEEDEAWQSL